MLTNSQGVSSAKYMPPSTACSLAIRGTTTTDATSSDERVNTSRAGFWLAWGSRGVGGERVGVRARGRQK